LLFAKKTIYRISFADIAFTNSVFTRGDRRGDRSRDRSPRSIAATGRADRRDDRTV